jgi:chromate reductase
MGGEAYISLKPGVVDANGTITDENTRAFLKAFVDQFAAFAARWSFGQSVAA